MAAVCVMAHGDEGILCGRDWVIGVGGGIVNIEDDILKHFSNANCRGLKGKPKLFIFQACRGDKQDSGILPAPGSAASHLNE